MNRKTLADRFDEKLNDLKRKNGFIDPMDMGVSTATLTGGYITGTRYRKVKTLREIEERRKRIDSLLAKIADYNFD